MSKGVEVSIVEFLCDNKKHSSKNFFTTREIADAVRLTIYQARGYLETLQSSGVVAKVNYGRGRPGQWRLI